MTIKNWRLKELLLRRKMGSAKPVPWPDRKQCLVLREFNFHGRSLHPAYPFYDKRHAPADGIEIEAGAELEQLVKGRFVDARPAATRYRIGEYAGWKPWAPIPGKDCAWEPGRGDPTFFDEAWVRVQSMSQMQVCAGLVMGPADGSFYLPVVTGLKMNPSDPAVTRFISMNLRRKPKKSYELVIANHSPNPGR
jgi:hypothetical protein